MTFLLRDARRSDLKGLLRLAAMLNTVNLPHNKDALEEVLDLAARSFSGAIEDPRERQYLFVAEETKTGKLVGTSMIIAQHGTKESPHLFFEVLEDERYSSTLDKHFYHTVLRLGKMFDGPTELGGLILDPAYRATPERLGKQLSYVRFLFIAMHKKWFQSRLLAELLPPLLPDGKSQLWEHLGRHFTGLDYTQADHISRKNKEFITSLFPHGEIQASLLPQEVQALIGEVGPRTLGVKRMLESIGFEYSKKIDPFDGGPHFEADIDDVVVINETQRRVVKIVDHEDFAATPTHMVGHFDAKAKNKFMAAALAVRLHKDTVELPRSVAELVRLDNKDRVFVMPLDGAKRDAD